MNPLAHELNTALAGSPAERLLSTMGTRLYFPKGIIAQAGEAKKSAHLANATIGMAVKDGKALSLSAIADGLSGLDAYKAVVYAPTAGLEEVRSAWKDAIIAKNPSIDPATITLPVVVPGLTAGINYMADLFIGEGQTLLTCDPSWDNYVLVVQDRHGATMKEIPFFKEGEAGLDIPTMEKAFREEAKSGSLRVILNFPQNPTGYSPSREEAAKLVAILTDIAESGVPTLVLCDDAYFGLAYEEEIYPESLFGLFAKASKNLLAVKIDGPTKEDYVWGLRMGFLTFGCKAMNAGWGDALIKKLMGAIRSSVSCANTPAQLLMTKTMEDPRSAGEKAAFKDLLEERYRIVKAFITAKSKEGEHPVLSPLPFNSGYFMSFRVKNGKAEELRQALLKDYGIGTISLGPKYLRVAFSSVNSDKLKEVYARIYEEAGKLA